jgi:hypothetical protein
VALELQAVGFDRLERLLFILCSGELEQLARLREPPADGLQLVDDLAQARALAAELLSPGRILPDVRSLELGENLDQTFLLGFELKDTP